MRSAERFFWNFPRDLNEPLANLIVICASKTRVTIREMLVLEHEMSGVVEVLMIKLKI